MGLFDGISNSKKLEIYSLIDSLRSYLCKFDDTYQNNKTYLVSESFVLNETKIFLKNVEQLIAIYGSLGTKGYSLVIQTGLYNERTSFANVMFQLNYLLPQLEAMEKEALNECQ